MKEELVDAEDSVLISGVVDGTNAELEDVEVNVMFGKGGDGVRDGGPL